MQDVRVKYDHIARVDREGDNIEIMTVCLYVWKSRISRMVVEPQSVVIRVKRRAIVKCVTMRLFNEFQCRVRIQCVKRNPQYSKVSSADREIGSVLVPWGSTYFTALLFEHLLVHKPGMMTYKE